MKILVIGKGGREHALVWKIAQSPRVSRVFAAPGNPGMASIGPCIEIAMDDFAGLSGFALEEEIDLTVIGPEGPLSNGLADHFLDNGLKVFGPSAAAARLESSKVFAKDLMARVGIPTAAHATFADRNQALAYISATGTPIVVKASGLAGGKGAVVCSTPTEARDAVDSMLNEDVFGTAGREIVIEEFMNGEEASIFALCDGTNFVSLASSQDHKAIFEGDQGPNTGGMGAYAPAPIVTPGVMQTTEDRIIRPALAEMRRLGHPFCGTLYCGVMIDGEEVRVVEFNCRFGDPEAQVVLPLLSNDLVDLIEAACENRLGEVEVTNTLGAAACIVMASGGYPDTSAYETNKEICILEDPSKAEYMQVFHADTITRGKSLYTAGGRVVGVTAVGDDIRGAVDRAYEGVKDITFENAYWRRDIAHRALKRLSGEKRSGSDKVNP